MSGTEEESGNTTDRTAQRSAERDTDQQHSAGEVAAHSDQQPVRGGPSQDGDCQDRQQVDEKAEEKADLEQTGQMYDLQPSDIAFRMDEVYVDQTVVRQLGEGFLQRFLPSLEKSKASVADILNNQTVVIETLEQENAKFKDCTAHLDLSAMMVKAKMYHNKLLTIKRDMAGLHDKAAKLKRRALKLQQQKQKEELQRAHQEERELEKEQMLTARVASP